MAGFLGWLLLMAILGSPLIFAAWVLVALWRSTKI